MTEKIITENGVTKRIKETITRFPDGSYEKNVEESIVSGGDGLNLKGST